MKAAIKLRPRSAPTSRQAASSPIVAPKRVAIYTRKSTEEGLDQAFNSLDAQREAVQAYVKSQAGEGWVALADVYDDGGFTGANTDRPALQRLLQDISAGRIDVVAVYKIDRISRSLLDFTRLMEEFRANDVTFVSVTQQFSTTTPAGRMTMNLLATFAEFERETIAERTRDKMGAARRRGMWTGGSPVLGYDLLKKKLVVNDAEAARVVATFELYRSLGSLMATVEELNARGWKSKTWTTSAGKLLHGDRYTKHSLRRLLTNRLYLGEVTYRGERFKGEHAAIIETGLFDAVGIQLRTHGRTGGTTIKNKHGALLKGLAVCGVCGSAMQYQYTQRGQRRFAYYVCRKIVQEGASACRGSRAPAGQLEEFVVDRVRDVGADPGVVEAAMTALRAEQVAREPELRAAVREHEAEVNRLSEEAANLTHAIGRGATVLGARLGEVDLALQDANRRAASARNELLSLESRVLDAAALRKLLADFGPVWEALFPKERARVLRLLIARVLFDGRTSELEIVFRTGAPASLGRSA